MHVCHLARENSNPPSRKRRIWKRNNIYLSKENLINLLCQKTCTNPPGRVERNCTSLSETQRSLAWTEGNLPLADRDRQLRCGDMVQGFHMMEYMAVFQYVK